MSNFNNAQSNAVICAKGNPNQPTAPTLNQTGSGATMLTGSDPDASDLISAPRIIMSGSTDAAINSFSLTYDPADFISAYDDYAMTVRLDGSISNIPEPTSAALGLGITAMLCLTLRRRGNKARD